MRKRLNPLVGPNGQRGISAVVVAVGLLVFIGMTALAVDLSFLYVARNELQNAADAGALAGARWLYLNDGTLVNENANQIAYDAATANRSMQWPVEVNWTSGNAGDVQRGHWSFATRTFTANPSTAPPDLWNKTTAELDADPNFINAVRVKARRQAIPVAFFFAKVFGHESRGVSAEAVGYIGYAGKLGPGDADQPIAICKQAITVDGVYRCGVGRFINSGSNVGHQTGGWTNFTQNPCDTASVPTMRPLVCGDGNPGEITLGDPMGTTGGELETVFDQLRRCWTNAGLDTWGDDGIPDQPWKMTLPVIDCPGNNVGPCSTPVGAVTVEVVWITRTDKNQMKEVPRKMGDWTCPPQYTGHQCWYGYPSENFKGFAEYFTLRDILNESPAIYEDKTIYFLPGCEPNIPAGTTGGDNFGVLARIPVLVN